MVLHHLTFAELEYHRDIMNFATAQFSYDQATKACSRCCSSQQLLVELKHTSGASPQTVEYMPVEGGARGWKENLRSFAISQQAY